MIEYVVNSVAWSAGGFFAGWLACLRWVRIEKKIDHIESVMEEQRRDDHEQQ